MKKKITYFPFVILILFNFLLLSLPPSLTDRIRYNFIAGISPSWEKLKNVGSLFGSISHPIQKKGRRA